MFNFFEFQREIYIVIMAMLPVIELRGAIPMGMAIGFTAEKSMILSILGNLLIIPILFKVLVPIMNVFEKTKLFEKTIGWIKGKALGKTKTKIKKYSIFGLFLLVAIPLPTTGAWAATIAASILKLDYKRSMLSIGMGVIAAGIIVYFLVKNII